RSRATPRPSLLHKEGSMNGTGIRAALALALIAGTARAQVDSDGFIMNWPGRVFAQFNIGGSSTPPLPVTTIEGQFDDAGVKMIPTLCATLQANISHSAWHACNVPPAGELRVKQMGANGIALKYIVTGVFISWDATQDTIIGPIADPTVDGQFDVEIDERLVM